MILLGAIFAVVWVALIAALLWIRREERDLAAPRPDRRGSR